MGARAYSLYDVEQFIREAGAERVTEDAVLNLERELEKLTEVLAHKAILYAAHAGRRKLIKRKDIMLTTGLRYSKPQAFRNRSAIVSPVIAPK